MAKCTNLPKGDGPNTRDEGEQSKTVSRKDKPSPQEENTNETREEGNEPATSCAFTEAYIWFYAHHTYCQFEAKTMIVSSEHIMICHDSHN